MQYSIALPVNNFSKTKLRSWCSHFPNSLMMGNASSIIPPLFRAAIIDVYSRKILGWSISNTMTAKWCTELIEDTIKTHGKPEIFNTDQSVQYTSEEHISAL